MSFKGQFCQFAATVEPSNPHADYLSIVFCYVNMAYMNKDFVLFPYHTLVLGGGRSRVGCSTDGTPFWGKCMYCHPVVG